MKTIDAFEFKTKCLELIDEIASTREPLLITKHGKPVVRIVPASLFGLHRGQIDILGDITSPIDDSWGAIRT